MTLEYRCKDCGASPKKMPCGHMSSRWTSACYAGNHGSPEINPGFDYGKEVGCGGIVKNAYSNRQEFLCECPCHTPVTDAEVVAIRDSLIRLSRVHLSNS